VSDKKIIAIAGATGAQGGGLARAILADHGSQFAVRALTRNVASDKAKALAAAGAEVVSADLDHLDTITRAFEGAHGAFCVTNFWEHLSPDREFSQATKMAEAAKRAGLSHVVWSTLEDSRRFIPLTDTRMPTLQARFKVPHFDAKGEADHVFADMGVPTTYLLTSFYWENFIYFGSGPKPGPDGVLALTLPLGSKKFPTIGVEDIGRSAYGIFKAGGEFLNRTVGIAGEHLTGAEMAAAMSRAMGREVRYNGVPPEVFRSFGFPGADDLGNMFQFYRDYAKDLNALRGVARSRELAPALLDFDAWLEKYKDRIPIK